MKNILIALLCSVIIIGGCTNPIESSSKNPEDPVAETAKSISKDADTYKSITEYSGNITGEHLKISTLQVSINGNSADLELKIFISDKLRKKMKNTEKPIYFSFGDYPGSHLIGKLLVESPPVFQIDLNSADGTYTLSQQLKLKENLSEAEKKTLLSPENHVLQILNEQKLAVAIFIGLEGNTMPQ